MTYMSEYEKFLISKLLNSLKGSALSVVSANQAMMTEQERLDAMEAIQKVKRYVESYPLLERIFDTEEHDK